MASVAFVNSKCKKKRQRKTNTPKISIIISDEITAFIFDKKIGGDVVLNCNYRQASGLFYIRGDILRALYIMHGDLTKFPPRLLVENPDSNYGYLLRNIFLLKSLKFNVTANYLCDILYKFF